MNEGPGPTASLYDILNTAWLVLSTVGIIGILLFVGRALAQPKESSQDRIKRLAAYRKRSRRP